MNVLRFWQSIRPDGVLLTRGQHRNWRTSLPVWGSALGMAAFWILLIWGIHWESPRTLVSFHGFLHAAIAGQFLMPAATFPPENPFFAGHSVVYYWFFQFLGAQLAQLFGWNVFYGMKTIILLATGILMIVSVGLGRALFRSTLAGTLMGYLIVAGTNPLGFIFVVWRIIRYGPQLLQNDPNFLWGVVHPLYSLIRFNDVGGLYGPLLNFFLNLTSRPAALATLLVMLYCLHWSLRGHSLLSWIFLGLAAAITTSLSPIVGISAGGALFGALVGFWLWTWYYANGSDETRHPNQHIIFLVASAVIIAGILIAAPTYYHLLLGPSDSQIEFWLFSAEGLRHSITVILSVFVLLVLAIVGVLKAVQDQRTFLGVLFLAALLLLAATVSFRLPSWNQSNFFHAAVVLLAVPAAGSILRSRAGSDQSTIRVRDALGVVLVFLPTLVLLLAAYVNRPALPLDIEGSGLARRPSHSELAKLYDWIQHNTSPEAVFVTDPRYRVAMSGNIAEFPALTGRTIFTEHFNHYIVSPYLDSKRRFDLAVRLVSGEELNSSDQSYIANLNRPVYIVSYQLEDSHEDSNRVDRMQDFYGPPTFQEADISVFIWSN